MLLIIELAVFTAINPEFLSILNISNTLTFTVELGLIALAMTLLMTAGEFDLSVGSLFGFAPVVMWTLFNAGLTSLSIAFLISLVVAALIGLFNGLFVTRLKIPSFLVTLGMLLVVRGDALFVTNGFPQRTWSAEGQWLARLLAGDFYIGSFRVYASLFWFIGARIDPRLCSDGDQVRQLDSGDRRQPWRCAGARRRRLRGEGRALHPLGGHVGLRRRHQLDPHLGRQSEQRNRI